MNETLTQSALASAMGEIAQLGKENHRLKSLLQTSDETIGRYCDEVTKLRASLAKAEVELDKLRKMK